MKPVSSGESHRWKCKNQYYFCVLVVRALSIYTVSAQAAVILKFAMSSKQRSSRSTRGKSKENGVVINVTTWDSVSLFSLFLAIFSPQFFLPFCYGCSLLLCRSCSLPLQTGAKKRNKAEKNKRLEKFFFSSVLCTLCPPLGLNELQWGTTTCLIGREYGTSEKKGDLWRGACKETYCGENFWIFYDLRSSSPLFWLGNDVQPCQELFKQVDVEVVPPPLLPHTTSLHNNQLWKRFMERERRRAHLEKNGHYNILSPFMFCPDTKYNRGLCTMCPYYRMRERWNEKWWWRCCWWRETNLFPFSPETATYQEKSKW